MKWFWISGTIVTITAFVGPVVARAVACGLLFAFGSFVVSMNWACLLALVWSGRRASMVPLVGPAFIAVALIAFPLASLARFVWLPLLLDVSTDLWAAHAWLWLGRAIERRRRTR